MNAYATVSVSGYEIAQIIHTEFYFKLIGRSHNNEVKCLFQYKTFPEVEKHVYKRWNKAEVRIV